MIHDDTRNKARAVLLAAIMVISIFGGSMALAGSAAAASGLSVDSGAQTTATGQVTVSVTLDDTTDGTGAATFQLEDSDSDTSSTFTVGDNETGDSNSATGAITTTIDLSSYENIDAEGTTTLYVNEGNSINVGTGGYDTATTFQIDNTRPTASSPIAGTVVSTTTPTVTVEMTEDQTSINRSTIEVTASNGGKQLFELNEPEAQGITYSESDQNLTIDIAQTKLDELPEGQIDFDILAQDAAGNQLDPSPSEFSFTVDTTPVDVTINPDGGLSPGATAGDTTSTASQTFKVDVSNETAAIDTASVTISGANGYQETLSKANGDGSYADGTWTFNVNTDGAEGNLPTLPDGDVTISASATDTDEASNSDSLTFTVDTAAPVVVDNGVTVNNGDVVNTNNAGSVPVSVTFNETVQADTVSGEIHLDSDNTPEVTLGGGVSPIVEDAGENVQTVTYEVDLSDDGDVGNTFENASASVRFTSASDDTLDGANTNDSLTGSASFEIDTVDPTVTIDNGELPGTAPHTLQNVVDLSEAFSASNADGNAYGLYISPGQSGDYVPLSDVSSEPLADFDTTTLPEGTHDLRINVTDAAGNTAESTVVINVDNYEPSVTYDGDDPLTGMKSGTEYDVADLVSVSDNGTDTISTYGFAEINDGQTKADVTYDTEDFTTGADPTVKVDSNTNYVFAVKLTDTDGTVLKADAVSTSVLTANSLGVTAERNASSPGSIDVTVTSDNQLDSLNVTASTDDSYVTQSSETLSDFAESGNSEDGFEYTRTYETDRDGQYNFALDNATATTGLSIESPDKSDTAQSDGSAPSLDSAHLTDGSPGSMTVQLTFSEPISAATFDQTFQGESVTLADASATDGDGVVNVTVGDEVQTGGETELVVSDVSEAFGANTGETTDTSADVTFELQLSSGLNVVSIPAETGSVDLEAIDQELQDAGVTNIQAYEPNADTEWPNYVPGNSEDADFTELTGGNGYVVSADQSATLDVNVENVPDGESLERSSKTLQNGWNLVGHFQEGSQSVDQAYATLPSGASYSVELGYTGDQVRTLQPGQGYWTFTNTNDAKLIPVDYTGLNSDRPQVANVQVSIDSTDGQTGFSTGDTVNISADVADDDLINRVEADSTPLGIDGVTLTDGDNDGTYDATDVSVDFTQDVTAGETDSVVVTAFDADNSIGVGSGQSPAVEEVAPSISSAVTADTDDDGDVDEITVTMSEPIDDDAAGDITDADADEFSVDGEGSVDTITTGSTPNDDTVVLTVSGFDGTDVTPTVTQEGGDAPIADYAGNSNSDTPSVTATDGAAPVMLSASTADDDNDGTVDHIDVTMSESLSNSDSTFDNTVFSTSDQDASLGAASTDDAEDDNQVDVVVNNAPADDTSFTLADLTLANDELSDGSNSLSSPQTLNTVSDGADAQVLTAEVTDALPGSTVELRFSEDVGPNADGSGTIDSQLSYVDGNGDSPSESFGSTDVSDGGKTITITVSTGDIDSADVSGGDAISIDSQLNSAGADGSTISTQDVDIEDNE